MASGVILRRAERQRSPPIGSLSSQGSSLQLRQHCGTAEQQASRGGAEDAEETTTAYHREGRSLWSVHVLHGAAVGFGKGVTASGNRRERTNQNGMECSAYSAPPRDIDFRVSVVPLFPEV